MALYAKHNYRVVAVYDTETTNIGVGSDTRAFPVLFIFNDLRNAGDLGDYEVGRGDIRFYRTVNDVLSYIDELVMWGVANDVVPVVAAYNLMFDLQPLMQAFAKSYEMRVSAQTATSVYTLDLVIDDRPVLRFWDTFYLEMNGLAAMGETCGLPKAKGDWDYTLVRTPETPLTELEKHYAARDTEVIPAYLRYLLQANEWLKSEEFGCRVLTKTSLVRRMASLQIGNRRIKKDGARGRGVTLKKAYDELTAAEFPRDYDSYALRKACFRGGLTFTAAATANVVVHNVASVDVTSMHHAFINGRKLPVHFGVVAVDVLQRHCEMIAKTSLDAVLSRYDNPFYTAVHAQIRFTNLRLRRGSCFDKWGVAILPRSKFARNVTGDTDIGRDDRARVSESAVRKDGYCDYAVRPVFAFGKLYAAESCVLHVNEIELWNISQVYEYDEMQVIKGELSIKSTTPPDYVTLQSNILFDRKTAVKNLIKQYHYGTPLTSEIPASIPEGIANEARAGTLSEQFLKSYYNSTVKGSFNSIYGTMAQNELKSDYIVIDGELMIDHSTVATRANFDDLKPKKPKVLYTYGMRIVAGSRMHLVIAMMLMHRSLGDKVSVTGGDTDSLKLRCDTDVTDDDIMRALSPLHHAVENAINTVQRRVRETAPDVASLLTHIGKFEIEDCGGSSRYAAHMEAWNKARISMDKRGHSHITCAGLSRPEGLYNILDYVDALLQRGHDFEEIAPLVLGYDVFVANCISHFLQRTRPHISDRYRGYVTDYLGNIAYVDTPESIALYPCGRWLGESDKPVNYENIRYLQVKYNRKIIETSRILTLQDNRAVILENETGNEIL